MFDLIRGLARLPKEHFTVYLGIEGQNAFLPMPASPWSYYADPFVWHHKGRTWLLVEEFEYLKNRGRLRCVPVDDKCQPGEPRPLISFDCHASFPFLFEHAGQLFMVPETSEGGFIDLFACDDFPGNWHRETRLMGGVDAADTVVFPHQGCWWMITSMREDRKKTARWLAVYYCDDIFSPEWQEHPVTRTRRFAGTRFSTGRNAGAVVHSGGMLLRLVQDNRKYYGESVRVMKIETLTPAEFEETPFTGSNTFTDIARRYCPHHISRHGGFVAFDVRDRVSYLQHFSRRFRPVCSDGSPG